MLGSNIVSPTHLLLVLLVAVLVFGTKKLPELGRGMGTAMREFKEGVTGKEPTPTPQALEATPIASAPEPAGRELASTASIDRG